MPAPEVVDGELAQPMDLVYVVHQGCGFNADGAANLGVEPDVIDASMQPRVAVPSGFDVRYSLSSVGGDEDRFADVGADVEGTFRVDAPGPGCYELVVELVRGELSGRFASRLDVRVGGAVQCAP